MWVFMNDSFLSIVESEDKNKLSIKSRIPGDLEAFFGKKIKDQKIIESEDTDYRYRVFADRKLVSDILKEKVQSINYTNFKNSVVDKTKHDAYFNVWQVMNDVQDKLFNRLPWWINYR